MTLSFRTHHLIQAVVEFSDQSLPLDLFLNGYYRTHKALGSKDRLFIGDTIYSLIRWKGLLDAVIPEPHNWEKRLETFLKIPLEELKKGELEDHDKVSFPKWLFDRLSEQLGQKKALEICLISIQQAPPTVRVNLMKTDRTTLLESLKKHASVEPTALGVQKRCGIQ